jgi:DNA-directed RNA polymerase
MLKKDIHMNVAVVHDCYSTDYNDIENMNLILRFTLKEMFENENTL